MGLLVEYASGFLVGWLVFQALFMKDMAGGSYGRAVRSMFMPEWLSMNGVMTGMAVVMVVWMKVRSAADTPGHGEFWLMMSAALIAGAIVAYPINWWLVSRGLKHGLMSSEDPASHESHHMPPSGVAHDGSLPAHTMHHSSAQGGTQTAYRSPNVVISAALFLAALAMAFCIK